MTEWQPFREPLRVTLTRTVTIALIAGAVAAPWFGGLRHWALVSLIMLWPAFGGHWVELWFLNWLRPRIPSHSLIQRIARVSVWFSGGILLGLGMRWTASMLVARPRDAWLTWVTAGIGFVAVELIAHVGLALRGRPSFYNGRG